MMTFYLHSQLDIVPKLARVFGPSAPSGDSPLNPPAPVRIQVCEEVAFGDVWLDLGEIRLQPLRIANQATNPDALVEQAVRTGYYEWALPPFEKVWTDAIVLVKKRRGELKGAKLDKAGKAGGSGRSEDLTEAQKDIVRRGLEAVPRIAVRCGLANPIFDPVCVSEMPWNRPTIVVVDTTAIQQGALDFLVRYLGGGARFRIPSVVHMELQTHVNNYFAYRRKGTTNPQLALSARVAGPGGQWVLLRLALSSSAGLERPRIIADPLRGIVSLDPDTEDKNLGIEKLNRSYADRLILETALHHQDQLPYSHTVTLLTGDEGLARMSLAEGLRPLFFRAIVPPYLFGETLSGVHFRPFVGGVGVGRLACTSLPALLWEFAAVFGRARLLRHDGETFVEIRAVGEELNWHPSHCSNDLLWASTNLSASTSVQVTKAAEEGDEPVSGVSAGQRVGFARITLSSLIDLLQELALKAQVRDEVGRTRLADLSEGRYKEFRRFLISAGFAEEAPGALRITSAGRELHTAFQTLDSAAIARLLERAPSYRTFRDALSKAGHLPAENEIVPRSAFAAYCDLAEVARDGVRIGGEGVFLTASHPSTREFSQVALGTYERLRSSDSDLVLTGAWLEALAKEGHLHPLVARELLNAARTEKLLELTTEGSTPDTSHERHQFTDIELSNRIPTVVRISLYDGSFLVPGRASVFIRLKEGKS